jgi:hypothetical protein
MGVRELSAVNVVITGATGMVGGLVLEQALAEPRIGAVTTLGRRATGVASPKLTEIEHADFEDFTGLEDVLAGQDAALFCLGAYTGSVPDDVFRKITVDCTVAFGEALRRANPRPIQGHGGKGLGEDGILAGAPVSTRVHLSCDSERQADRVGPLGSPDLASGASHRAERWDRLARVGKTHAHGRTGGDSAALGAGPGEPRYPDVGGALTIQNA